MFKKLNNKKRLLIRKRFILRNGDSEYWYLKYEITKIVCNADRLGEVSSF